MKTWSTLSMGNQHGRDDGEHTLVSGQGTIFPSITQL